MLKIIEALAGIREVCQKRKQEEMRQRDLKSEGFNTAFLALKEATHQADDLLKLRMLSMTFGQLSARK